MELELFEGISHFSGILREFLLKALGFQLMTLSLIFSHFKRQLPSSDVSERLAKEWKMLDGWDNEHEEMQGKSGEEERRAIGQNSKNKFRDFHGTRTR